MQDIEVRKKKPFCLFLALGSGKNQVSPLVCTLVWILVQIRWPDWGCRFPAIAFVLLLIGQKIRSTLSAWLALQQSQDSYSS